MKQIIIDTNGPYCGKHCPFKEGTYCRLFGNRIFQGQRGNFCKDTPTIEADEDEARKYKQIIKLKKL